MNQPEIPKPPDILRDRPKSQSPEELRQEVNEVSKQEAVAMGSSYASAFGFIGTVLVFGGLGWLVDWWLHTGPWGLIVGFGAGLAGSTYKLMREAARSGK